MMKRLAIALVCAVAVIGVETYLLLEPLPPPPPLRAIAITPPVPPAPPPPKPVVKRRAAARKTLAHATTANLRPFMMPTGGIFSGVDPQDPKIYHFNAK